MLRTRARALARQHTRIGQALSAAFCCYDMTSFCGGANSHTSVVMISIDSVLLSSVPRNSISHTRFLTRISSYCDAEYRTNANFFLFANQMSGQMERKIKMHSTKIALKLNWTFWNSFVRRVAQNDFSRSKNETLSALSISQFVAFYSFSSKETK